MKKLILVLLVTIGITLTGCTLNNPKFEFQRTTVRKEYSNELVTENVSESFLAYWDNYYIDDFAIVDDYAYLTYVKYVDEVEVWVLAAFDDSFELLWEREIPTSYYLQIPYINEEIVIVRPKHEDSFFYKFLVYSHDGTLVYDIDSLDFIEVRNGEAYFVESIFDGEVTYQVTRISAREKEVLVDTHGSHPFVRYFSNGNVMVTDVNSDANITVQIIDNDGELLFEKEYTNNEDIYNVLDGFLVDDEENKKIELYDINGDFVWEVNRLKDSIKGLKIVDGNLVLKEGDKALTISPKGRVISRKDEETDVPIDTGLDHPLYRTYVVRKKFIINDDLTLFQVKYPHDVILTGLTGVFFDKNDEILLEIGGTESYVEVEYFTEEKIFLYEKPMSFQYLPGNHHLIIVDYEGNLLNQYEVLTSRFDDDNGYLYYIDGTSIYRTHLPYTPDDID